MKVYKFYDACCDNCGNWYGATFKQPETNNKEEAVKEIESNGWVSKNGKTLCRECK